jgi:hypothetical protein
MTSVPVDAEFDRQVANLLRLGYPALAGMTEERFRGLLAPLRAEAAARAAAQPTRAPTAGEATAGTVPLLVVVSTTLVPAERTLPLTTLAGRTSPGHAAFDPDDLARFAPAELIAPPVPDHPVYLITGVQRGEEFCNVTPDDAVPAIVERGRSPLTIAEGVALITHYPTVLVKNRCFSLAGSRCGDRRVPALWISKGAPKLGWCWAGNPHTWLGTASCGARWVLPAARTYDTGVSGASR